MRVRSQRSFDIARVAAMTAVALHHALSISNIPTPFFLGDRLTFGQVGVTMFCAISGFFSMQSRGTSPLRWLRRRLARVYAPYWLILTAMFAVNFVAGHKEMSLGLVLSQYLGTGFFTHPDRLIGIHFWFLSLILLCYGMAAFARRIPASILFFAVAVSMTLGSSILLGGHLLSFLVGCGFSLYWRHRGFAILASILFVACLLASRQPASTEFAYPAVAILTLCFCRCPMGESGASLTLASERTYEFYLVHGPVYVGLRLMFHAPFLVNITLGTVLATTAAILLEIIARPLVARLQGPSSISSTATGIPVT